ncbi:MAG: hypothetical protein ACLP2J_03800 [Acidimicrobiales bacterium]
MERRFTMDEAKPVEGSPVPDRPTDDELDAEVDEAEVESFPSSDPQSSWAGPDRPPGTGRRVERPVEPTQG